MKSHHLIFLFSFLLVVSGCASSTTLLTSDSAPWSHSRLSSSEVPPVLIEQWLIAENKDSCAPVAPKSLLDWEKSTVRSAYFGGGWAIAFDTAETRSAFGIAGAGVDASGPIYDNWPVKKTWPDGSHIGYGPEGGSGPKELAYLQIAGQGCLYNVWTHLGRDHLEELVMQLRMVDVSDL